MFTLASALLQEREEENECRIVICGLDFAGKSTLLESLKRAVGQKHRSSTVPTVGMNVLALRAAGGYMRRFSPFPPAVEGGGEGAPLTVVGAADVEAGWGLPGARRPAGRGRRCALAALHLLAPLTVVVVDVGGSAPVRRLWRHYTADAAAALFVVDASQPERWEEAATELQSLVALLSEATEVEEAAGEGVRSRRSRAEPGAKKGDARPPPRVAVVLNKMDVSGCAGRDAVVAALGLPRVLGQCTWKAFACSALTHRGVCEAAEWAARVGP